MYSMQNNGQFCSVPQVHWVHQNKCVAGHMEGLLREMHFEYFKVFKKEAGGFPSLAQGKEIDCRTCGITFDCFTHVEHRFWFSYNLFNTESQHIYIYTSFIRSDNFKK